MDVAGPEHAALEVAELVEQEQRVVDAVTGPASAKPCAAWRPSLELMVWTGSVWMAPSIEGETAVSHHAGIDVSLERSSVCVVDATGRIVREGKIPSEPEALVAFLREVGVTLERVGLEAGPLSQWLRAGLVAAGLPAVLIETRHVRAALKAMTMKTDRNDARGIAHLMRLGWFRPVHAKTLLAQEIRALLTARKQLVGKLCDIEASLRGILRGFGLKVGEIGRAGFAGRVRELATGQAMLERVVEPMLRAREALATELATLHRQMLAIVREHEVCRRLMTVPGVGPVVAITYVAAIDDPGRFKKSKELGAHFGLVPRKYQSGEVDYSGRISKFGDAMVRAVLYEAANVILTRAVSFSSLKAWALRVAGRAGMKKARVALARKLAVILHRMWVDGTSFRWSAPAVAAA
jgi:transposase